MPWSTYDSTGWSSTAVDDGYTAHGNRALSARVELNDDNTTTEIDGEQTWKGDGELTADDTVDLSAVTKVRMSVSFGPHHADCGGEYTVTIGVRKAGNSYPIASRVLKAQTTLWGDLVVSTVAAGDRSALTAYVTVDAPDADHRWCVSRLQLWDRETYGDVHVVTAGVAITRTTTEVVTGAVVACKKCRDPRLNRINDYQHQRDERGVVAEDLVID